MPEEKTEALNAETSEASSISSNAVSQPTDVTWTASEFIAHHKSAGWYLGLAIGAAVFAAFIFFITRDVVSVIVVIVAALVLGSYGTRKPRQLEYQVDQKGLTIGGKHHSYEEFKSYSVTPEGAFSGISLMPLKRFAPIITIYYASEDEERIMAVLSPQLPYEEPQRDTVDSLMRRIRF